MNKHWISINVWKLCQDNKKEESRKQILQPDDFWPFGNKVLDVFEYGPSYL